MNRKTMNLIAFLFLIVISFFPYSGITQEKFYTKSGIISFYSQAPLENIEAHNKSVTAVLAAADGDLQFAVLLKGFEFRKALMQEHFNKNYVESDRYPKATFKGRIRNNALIDYRKNGSYEAIVDGKLTIHGQTRDIEVKGTVSVKEGTVGLDGVFNILLADYNISIPRIYWDNISPKIRITVDCTLRPL